MNRVDGKVAVITGGARGIGAETAKELAAGGARVMITDVLETEGAATVAEIERAGGEAAFLKHDVTSESEWRDVIAQTVERFGGLHVLVNNAGVYLTKPLEETTLEEWRWVSAVNLEGVFLGTKHAIGAMKQSGGSIINLSSVAGLVGATLGSSAYSMSKGGVRLFTKSAALECAQLGYGIRVNSVHPGVIETDMGNVVIDKTRQVLGGAGHNQGADPVDKIHPLGRLGQASDVAKAILFLASDDSSFMTGSEVVVDGGYTAR